MIEHYRNENLIIGNAEDLVESKNKKLFVVNNILGREKMMVLKAE